ncbi:MAG: amidohydrolase [Bacteroidetes bacterium]|nr:amidohydrolase [Bacteroidota bacterium]MBT3751285.1 amidohydrolase [Bacteroidota bacterium]MBT4400790.1 amidohydrolase [Bacteroidota bacterium]MBT4411002.1 amidohydrolase [Bacteroidota bacterium]MBT5425489.1 amidohydrolase [Bacteroidota bacterium]
MILTKYQVDIAITGGDIITMDPDFPLYENGLILVKGHDILYCGKKLESSEYNAAKIISANGSVILPPFFNQHTHPSISLFRGLGADLKLMEWLERVIWPLEKQFCHPDFVYLGTQLSLAEMILNGTGAAAIMDFHCSSVGDAFIDAGIRGFIGEAIFDGPSPSCKNSTEGFAYTEFLLNKFSTEELLDVLLVIHAPFTSSPETYSLAAKKAREWNIISTSHVAETHRELKWSMDKFGKTPVELLENAGIFEDEFVLVHGVHLINNDIEILSRNEIPVIHNPHSNMILGSGICPVPELLRKGVKVGIGTDSAASNNNLSMLREMQTAARLHKVSQLNASELPADQVLKMATSIGYSNYGKSEIGKLKKGWKADLQIIDLTKVHNTPYYNVASALAYSAHPEDINTLIVNGELIMEDRNLLTLDLPLIMKEVRKTAEKISKFMTKQHIS